MQAKKCNMQQPWNKCDWSAQFSRDVLVNIDQNPVDMYWHVGDIGYADDAMLHTPLRFQYENVWNGYMNWFGPAMVRKPYMVSPGNHESECHDVACFIDPFKLGLRNFTAYNHRFAMPSTSSDGVLNMWYSYNFGGAHFVSMNSETDFPGAAEEHTGDSGIKYMKAGRFGRTPDEYLTWLEKDLKEAAEMKNNGTVQWIIAGSHRPIGDYDRVPSNKPNYYMKDLMKKYNVDAYFSGHSHSYGRQGGVGEPLWIISGGSGCDEMMQDDPETNSVHYKDFNYANYSVGYLTMSKESLVWELLDSVSGVVVDSFTINATRSRAESLLV